MSELYNVTNEPLTGGGIFSVMDPLGVPWEDENIALQLDMAYYGNYSGSKITSPLVDKLLENGVLSDAAMLKLANVILSINSQRWAKEWDTLFADYDPISNYDMVEEMSEEGETSYGHTRTRTDNLAHTETRTDNLTHTVDGSEVEIPNVIMTEQESVRAFNSGSDQPSTKTTQTPQGNNRTDNDVTEHDTGTQAVQGTNSGTQSENEGGADSNSRDYTLTRRGNIGVTTSQQMLTSERELWLWNYFTEVVFPDVDKVLTTPVYLVSVLDEESAGGITPTGRKNIYLNGVYDVTNYAEALVNVDNTYTEADEGKVVSGGELVAQTEHDILSNGSYNTTLFNHVRVNVPNTYRAADEGKVVSGGQLVAQTSREIDANGTFDTTNNNEVTINVPYPKRNDYVAYFTPDSNATNALSGGWKFTPNSDLTLVGIRFFARSTEATVYISDINGTTIVSKTVTGLNTDAWNDIMFDEPITLVANTQYTVWGSNADRTMSYYRGTINPSAVVFRGAVWNARRYTFPSSSDEGVVYALNLIIEVSASCNVYLGTVDPPPDNRGFEGDFYIEPATADGTHKVYIKHSGMWIGLV